MSEEESTAKEEGKSRGGVIISIVRTFLSGPLSILIILIALMAGLMAVFATPREEEPQIVVPMVDVSVNFPGHSPAEVEQLVAVPLERLLWQVEGVEHVYSISKRDSALVTVRFYVGEDRDRAMVKVRDKINANLNIVPPGVTGWIVKSVEIDDVPILTLSFFSEKRSAYELRRIAEEVKARLDSLRDISLTDIFGGYKREITIEPDIENMASRGMSVNDIASALVNNNSGAVAGSIVSGKGVKKLLIGPALENSEDVRKTVISKNKERIVRIEDVAKVIDGPVEQENYVNIGFGPASPYWKKYGKRNFPAVTLAFSKKRGTNAVSVAKNIVEAAGKLKGKVIPDDVNMIVTRDYGETADSKVNDLISGLISAIITVVVLITLTMGWREGVIVGLAVPVSFSLSLFVNYISGYTINRVTLFALILSLGLVVDDPITNVDNIQRHIRIGLLKPFRATLYAVQEVLPPVIMSTLAIIVSFTPMFFITGMMGPYMGPMAINVPLTVTFSTFCALTFVPWLSLKLLKNKAGEAASQNSETKDTDATPESLKRLYAFLASPFLKKRNAILMLGAICLMLAGSAALMLLGVPLKMLPFDNKNELQLILEMPEGTNLENTLAATKEIDSYLSTINEVKNYETYTGLNAPIDFNGLVRHYGMRRNPNQADIRLNLADKTKRAQQSHTIGLRIRDKLSTIAEKHGGILKIVEIPPGPPVLSTITVQISGSPDKKYSDLIKAAKILEERMRETDPKHIVEIDDMAEAPHPRIVFTLDKDKASTHGISVSDAEHVLESAIEGEKAAVIHTENERNPLFARIRLPLKERSDIHRLGQLWLKGNNGKMVQLSELGSFREETEEQPVFHKNLERIVFVTAECAGLPPGEIIMKIWRNIGYFNFLAPLFPSLKGKPLPEGIKTDWASEGEWQITLRVFRDLGIAFGVAMIGIFLLLIIQTNSIVLPLIIMCAIPLTIIGIAPGFYLLNLISGGDVSGYPDPVFFTATGMIGMIALGGIVIRNSIVLIEFIQDSMARGNDIKKAILESGAVRFRPIILTAATTMIGAWPITLDPIFSGLAWALIFGLVASTFFTLLVIPAIYMLTGPGINKRKNIPTELKNGSE